MMDLEMPDLPDDTAADAEAILKANADDGSDELSGFDGVDAADGTLEDLDSINLDDIDLGDESGMLEPAPRFPTFRQRIQLRDPVVLLQRPQHVPVDRKAAPRVVRQIYCQTPPSGPARDLFLPSSSKRIIQKSLHLQQVPPLALMRICSAPLLPI